MAFPFLTIFLIIILFLTIRYRTLARKHNDIVEKFWEAEAAANAAPPVDLTKVEYITLPLSRFPIGHCSDEEVRQIEDELLAFADAKCLNLANKTNTEVKLTYGVANFETVTALGETCDSLLLLLKDYAAALVERQLYQEAIPVLEFCVGIHSDISTHYTMLGTCYAKLGKTSALTNLKEQVKASGLMLSSSILKQLDEIEK